MGMSTEFIRGEISAKQLEAEDAIINGRRVIRIYLEHFRAYLVSIGWKHLPTLPQSAHDASSTPTEPSGDPRRSVRA